MFPSFTRHLIGLFSFIAIIKLQAFEVNITRVKDPKCKKKV